MDRRVLKLYLSCFGVMHRHMTVLWADDCSALLLHPGDRLPCKVASLCMSASDGGMTETKCYFSAVCLLRQSCGCNSNYSCSSKIWKCSEIMMCQGIRQSDSIAKLHAFIRSGLHDEPGSYQIEFKPRYRGFTWELCISKQPH